MGGKLDPVILNHVLQCVVATQSGQSTFSCELLDVAANNIVHSIFLEGPVLIPDHLELPIDLPQQEATLEELEGHVVETENLKISTHKPRVLIRAQLASRDLGEHPPADLDDESRNVEGKEIYNLIDGFSASDEVASPQKLQYLDQLI